VQVEAGDERNVRADQGSHPAQHLALAIVKALADHGAVQVEIDPVEGHAAFSPANNPAMISSKGVAVT
jgi:hypothetical protein